MCEWQISEPQRRVSNPIREYLQIRSRVRFSPVTPCFKPYKGVSSNLLIAPNPSIPVSFKPYKGVSSNTIANVGYFKECNGFKPYKGVSSNKATFKECIQFSNVSNPIREYLQIRLSQLYLLPPSCFKPYKGVSSNDYRLTALYLLPMFQTL